MKKLRKECPWDQEQTHESLLPYLDEECLELKDAIYNENPQAMIEELGDVLLQVVFHTELAREAKKFTMKDVIHELNEKLIVRHPHVFKKNHSMAHTLEEQWEKIKHATKKTTENDCLHKNWKQDPFSAALYLQRTAAKAKFDWNHVKEILEKLKEEISELEHEISRGHQKETEKELGDVIFTLVNLARFLKINPSRALHDANGKFKKRWTYVKKKCETTHKDVSLKKIPMSVKESYWIESKQVYS